MDMRSFSRSTPGKPSLNWTYIFSRKDRLGIWGQTGKRLKRDSMREQAS